MSNRDGLLRILHDLCMAYPAAEEIFEGSVGDPVYKVSGKIFAMQHQVEGNPSVWMKAPPGVQEALIGSDPTRYFRPPYVGHNGWVGAWLNNEVVWPEFEDMIDESYRMTATKTLIRELDALNQEDDV